VICAAAAAGPDFSHQTFIGHLLPAPLHKTIELSTTYIKHEVCNFVHSFDIVLLILLCACVLCILEQAVAFWEGVGSNNTSCLLFQTEYSPVPR
jgi:hypothetical protein